ncbi:MAG: DUF805 domain-containing protein [Pseudomonadota bacterium]
MNDAVASPSALDPDRPWITDEEQLPSRMNWLETLFNPSGESPTLHFTRAWTLLFMMQLAVWFGAGNLGRLLFSAAGSDMVPYDVFVGYMTAFVYVITTVLSYIIHVRRLNHAGRSSLWAVIVLAPVVLALAQFSGTLMQKSAEYDEAYSARAEYLEDPAAWRAKALEEQRTAQQEAAEERANNQEQEDIPEMCKAANANNGDGGGNRGGGRGDWGDRGPNVEQPLASKEEFILRPAAAGIVPPIMFLSIPIMIWSLLWVARAPLNGAQYPKRGLVNILTTTSGRISRLQYIAGLVTILALIGIMLALQGILSGVAPAAAPVALILALPILWFGFCITSKRLHDLGKSWFFMCWPWIITLGVGVLTAGVVFLNLQAFLFAQTCGGEMPIAVLFMFIVLGIAAVCSHLGTLFLLCTAQPEMQDNKYGPAPEPGDTGAQFADGYAPRGYESTL